MYPVLHTSSPYIFRVEVTFTGRLCPESPMETSRKVRGKSIPKLRVAGGRI